MKHLSMRKQEKRPELSIHLLVRLTFSAGACQTSETSEFYSTAACMKEQETSQIVTSAFCVLTALLEHTVVIHS